VTLGELTDNAYVVERGLSPGERPRRWRITARWWIRIEPAAVEAAISAAQIRLRPILMTSFAFILGVLPLVFAIRGDDRGLARAPPRSFRAARHQLTPEP
jgi:hypothetical protein